MQPNNLIELYYSHSFEFIGLVQQKLVTLILSQQNLSTSAAYIEKSVLPQKLNLMKFPLHPGLENVHLN